MRKTKNQELAIFSLMVAITLLMSFTPLGFLNLGIIKATLMHIPVILTSMILGEKYGMGIGLLFALTSIFKNTTTPSILSFAFSPFIPVIGTDKGSLYALVVSIVPRLILGYLPAHLTKRKESNDIFTVLISSIVHSTLVLLFIYLFFKDSYAIANNIAVSAVFKTLTGVILANALPEAIIAVIVIKPLLLVVKRDKR